MLKMWKEDYKNKKQFRIIIPVVFYHGKSNWNIPLEFIDNFNINDDIKNGLLNFRYVLFNLNEENIKLLFKKYGLNSDLLLAITLLKNYSNLSKEDIKYALRFWLKERDIGKDKDLLLYYLNYMVQGLSIKEEEVEHLVDESIEGGEDIMGTMQEYWLKKGKNIGLMEGKREGLIEDKQEILIRQLSKKFGLDNKEKELIKSIKDKEKLDKALDLILDANNKEEVLNVISKSYL